MDQMDISFERYLKETLDISVQPKKWEEAEKLPFFLRNLYAFFEVPILETSCLAIFAKDEIEQTPATIRKHILQVQKKWHHEVIYVKQKVSAYNRKRLIEHKMPFVIPGNQMYLPFFGIDLREHFKKFGTRSPVGVLQLRRLFCMPCSIMAGPTSPQRNWRTVWGTQP